MDDQTDAFDAEQAVAEFRRVIAKCDAATTEIDRDEYRRMAVRMRMAWKEWQGEDSLYEMAFGEPYE